MIAPFSFAQDNAQDDIFELSPFTVSAEENQGYRATSTLAGSRLKTSLKDVGQSISVLTSEFFEDTGATDAASVLSYAMSTEVGGEQGNFADANVGGGGQNSTSTASMRSSPQQSQRVRGLARAQLTRDYFLTDIPFDGYNTSSVTISRGPNSLLFGIGSPGGVIENSLSHASLGKDMGEFSIRFGERSSNRATFDYNKVLVDERLAIRISGLKEKTNFKQRPSFEEDSRVFLSFNSVLAKNENSEIFGKTILRGHYENGGIDSNPSSIIAPGNSIKDWFEKPNPEIQEISGVDWATSNGAQWAAPGGDFSPKWVVDNNRTEGFPKAWRTIDGSARPTYFQTIGVVYQPDGTPGMLLPDAPNIVGTQSRIQYTDGQQGREGAKPRGELFFSKAFEAETFSTGFTIPVIGAREGDRNIFDNMNHLITGNTNWVNHDFEAHNLTFEQTFFDGKAGIELSFDNQSYENDNSLTMTDGRWNTIAIDVNEFTTYEDRPNPNVGRPAVFLQRGNRSFRQTDRETFRANAFYDLDFTGGDGASKWLGRHVISGIFIDQQIDSLATDIRGKYIAKDFDYTEIIDVPISNFLHDVAAWQYLGPSYLDDSSVTKASDVKVTNTINLPRFQTGEDYEVSYWDDGNNLWKTGTVTTTEILNASRINRDTFESEVYSIQSYLLNGNIVGLAGWRTDSIENLSAIGDRLTDGNVEDPSDLMLSPQDPIADADTFTWSVVGHIPIELPGNTRASVHYSESENFEPTGLRRNAYGNPINSPQGTTKEFGFSLDMFQSKLNMRFNWYDTVASGNQASVGSAIGGSLDVIVTALNEWQRVADGRVLNGDDNPYTIDQALSPLSTGGLQDSGLDASGRFSSYDQMLSTILGTVPEDVQNNAQIQQDATGDWAITGDMSGRVATQDIAAEGFEVEIVANPSSNWRIGVNIAQQETITSNTASVLGDVIGSINENLKAANLADIRDRPESTTGFVFDTTYGRSAFQPMVNARAKDGTAVQELREWRANAFTNYSFPDDSMLKGFSVGGALRWQDSVATGYELKMLEGALVSDTSKPFYGPDDLAGDLWITHKRKIRDNIDWKIQLNIRNLIGEDDFIPVGTNPDGSLAVVRNPNPTEVFLTNTFSF